MCPSVIHLQIIYILYWWKSLQLKRTLNLLLKSNIKISWKNCREIILKWFLKIRIRMMECSSVSKKESHNNTESCRQKLTSIIKKSGIHKKQRKCIKWFFRSRHQIYSKWIRVFLMWNRKSCLLLISNQGFPWIKQWLPIHLPRIVKKVFNSKHNSVLTSRFKRLELVILR